MRRLLQTLGWTFLALAAGLLVYGAMQASLADAESGVRRTGAVIAAAWTLGQAAACGMASLLCGFGAAVLGRLDRIAGLLSTGADAGRRERAEPTL